LLASAYAREMALLEQAEVDALLAMEKHRVDTIARRFPVPGNSLTVPLKSVDGSESFTLDIQRKGRIKLSKITFQERVRNEIVLARLDIDGPPHRNPDQTEVPCPHLHIYKEGYDTRIAIPAPPVVFTNTADLYALFFEFMAYCNVTLQPIIDPVLL
jgi:hypothetical protein